LKHVGFPIQLCQLDHRRIRGHPVGDLAAPGLDHRLGRGAPGDGLQPKGAEAKTGLGYVALENGNPELAIRLFRRPAAEVHPDALIGLGDAYRRLGRMRDALKQYRAYQRRYPHGERASIARRQIELLQEQIND
jgi:hypothetical protein